MNPRILAFLGLGLALLSLAPSVHAEATAAQKAVASQLFDEAQDLVTRDQVAEACAKYAESQRIDPQLGTLLYLGECYDQLGRPASAWATFKDAAEIAAVRGDPRESAVRLRLTELAPRVSKLLLEVAPTLPEHAQIRENGSLVGRAVWGSPVPVDPGRYQISVTAEGYQEWHTTVEIPADGSTVRVAISTLSRLPGPESNPAKPWTGIPEISGIRTPSGPSSSSSLVERQAARQFADAQRLARGRAAHQAVEQDMRTRATWAQRRRSLGYALGGVGAVAWAVGTTFGVLLGSTLSERDRANQCSATWSCTPVDKSRVDQLTADAKRDCTVANVSWVVAGTALLSSTLLVISGWPKRTNPPRASVSMDSWVSPQTAGVTLGGKW